MENNYEENNRKENSRTNEAFSYTYSAKEQSEIQDIRKKYAPQEDKMERLRRLDRSTSQKGMEVSLAVGIAGTLLLGIGMCCCLEWSLFVPGILAGSIGIAGVVLAYPLYNLITRKEREKIAPEIIRLTDELMK